MRRKTRAMRSSTLPATGARALGPLRIPMARRHQGAAPTANPSRRRLHGRLAINVSAVAMQQPTRIGRSFPSGTWLTSAPCVIARRSHDIHPHRRHRCLLVSSIVTTVSELCFAPRPIVPIRRLVATAGSPAVPARCARHRLRQCSRLQARHHAADFVWMSLPHPIGRMTRAKSFEQLLTLASSVEAVLLMTAYVTLHAKSVLPASLSHRHRRGLALRHQT